MIDKLAGLWEGTKHILLPKHNDLAKGASRSLSSYYFFSKKIYLYWYWID